MPTPERKKKKKRNRCLEEKSWLYGQMNIQFSTKLLRFASVGVMLMVEKWISSPEEIGVNVYI